MAYCGLREGREEVPGGFGPVHALYQKLSAFPSVVYASVGAGFAACGIARCLPLYTEWCQTDLRRHQRVRYSRQYILHRDGTAVISVTPVGVAAEIRDQYVDHPLALSCVIGFYKFRPVLDWFGYNFVQDRTETRTDKAVWMISKTFLSLKKSPIAVTQISDPFPRLLMRMSPSGRHKAIFTYHLEKGQKQEVLEVWSNIGRVRSINLTALDKHGKIYADEQFGCVSWSSSEGDILYVAERRRSKTQTLSPQDRFPKGEKPNKTGMEEKFVYYDNWGEALADKSVPVLCVLKIETDEVSVLEGIPGHISPGQALWSPDDKGVVFVGWWHEPFRLGLSACSNRRSALFHLDLSECSCEQLSSDYQAVSSPRLSPDGRHLIYLEGPAFGPHRQCLKLQMSLQWGRRERVWGKSRWYHHHLPRKVRKHFTLKVFKGKCVLDRGWEGRKQLDWHTKHVSTVVDVAQSPTMGFFGIYPGALPLLCWTPDNNRIILNTPQRSRKELLVVDTHLGSVKSITTEMPEGSWTVLGIHQDLLVVSSSSPNCPPSLKVAVLPTAGRELELQWVTVGDASGVPDVEWKILTVHHPPASEEGTPDNDQAFEALLLSPSRSKESEIFPLIVSPHGGPHAVFDACWRPAMACFCQLGFAVLLVNYRGSLGFGQASIDSLISHVGKKDVEDTQLAVELALQMEPLDPNRIALLGGSHGGFICCHLIGRYPERYKVCAVRSPVINMATLLGTSDIPDWRFSAVGLPYGFERIPVAEDLAAMLLRSPIAHAAKVQAPVLLCVGARDRRVSPYQAIEYYHVLQARGVPVRLMDKLENQLESLLRGSRQRI